jgi:ABC-2 type transport system ATP-binding protein
VSEHSTTSDAPALEIKNVTKRYDEIVAVRGVSFTINREIFGLLGANGAGKSTLIKSILGLVKADEGEVRVCGLSVRSEPFEAKKRIGYLPEDLRLYERLTGWEFLNFIAGIKGLDAASELEEWLAYFHLYDKRHLLTGEYSLGMKKKIGLIAALVGAPPLILLDEPLTGLDAESMRHARLRIEELAARGSTFVISSHIMGFIERVCHRVAVLKQGSVVIEGHPSHLRDTAGMTDAPFEDVFLHYAI